MIERDKKLGGLAWGKSNFTISVFIYVEVGKDLKFWMEDNNGEDII